MSRPESVAGSASTPSHAPRPPAPKSRSISPSNISLFVSNLKLLNLDQRQDWPDITVRTFDTKDALQNQKKRVACVEWSLYRLFEIWDRETTRDKLQPFFPPLEPIQSLNLRAALFRCLNDLKKNDVLGREATLRKTMLDDCKGDKFEEVLLLFSAAVVRKQVVSTRRKQQASIGKNLAVARNLDKRELNTVGPLSLAYCASLTKTLQHRVNLDHTLNNFRTSLYEKTNEYHERHLTLLETQDATKENFSPETEKSIRRELRQNWVGGIEGCDALLAGAKLASSDAYMDSNFEDLWQHFRQGTTPEVSPEGVSLLETLQYRVAEQNDRLRLWRAYKDVFEDTNTPVRSVQASSVPDTQDRTAAAHGLDIFRKHKSIRVAQTPSEPEESRMLASEVDYDRVVQDMRQSLSDVGKKKRSQNNGSSYHAAPTLDDRTRRTSNMPRQVPVPVFLAGSKEPQEDFFSPLKRPLLASTNSTPTTVRDEPQKSYPFLPRTHSQPVNTPQTVRSEYIPTTGQTMEIPYGSVLRQPRFTENSPSVQKLEQRRFEAYKSESQDDDETTPRNGNTSPAAAEISSAFPEHLSPAADPVASLEDKINRIDLTEPQGQSSPLDLPDFSPPQLSSPPAPISRQQGPQERPNLSERARISMASFHSSENSYPLPLPTPDSLDVGTETETDTTISRRTSLADRALASMTLATNNAPPHRRTTTAKPRPRSSFFPSTTAAQFSTPIKTGKTSLGGTRDTTPRDKLFEQDAEYASVFKSRPKIAMSPGLSPQLDEDMDYIEGEAEDFSFEDGGAEDGGEESMIGLQSSPLGKFGM
ncbi:hypothetical protein D6C76_04077 [Aureobasidium pullulans]|uniref:HAUS augmin-like complex subunit 6 N-terminal domain-containing protein n=1 Tax=Aureobasidium pullulans TaxID=5580 RepID=A0A4T0EV58_AURPU|nr:hypothetical protein D6C83_07513 [Aureobasidium pullulans]TIA78429.1 hypothetical protein D6C76_04077 [Aureobasidium pullulans]